MSADRETRVLMVENTVQVERNFRKLLALIENVTLLDVIRTALEAQEVIRTEKPDIVLVDESMPDLDGLTFTKLIHEQFPAVQIILLSQNKHYDMVLNAVRAGACDYITYDINTEDFRNSILRAADLALAERAKLSPYYYQPEPTRDAEGAPLSGERASIISVYSPRGGSGVTTLANNLALSLRDNESQIGLVDSSLQFGDVDILFNEIGQLSLMDLAPIAHELDPKVIKEVMLLHRNSGLLLLSGPKTPVLSDQITGEQASRILEYMRPFYRYVVINTHSYLNDATLASLDASEVVVLLVTQDISSVKAVRTFLDVWEHFGMKRERIMLVLNRFNKDNPLSPRKISDSLNATIEGTIPVDWEAAQRAGNLGRPLVTSNPNSELSKAITELAGKIKAKLPTVETETRFRLFLRM